MVLTSEVQEKGALTTMEPAWLNAFIEELVMVKSKLTASLSRKESAN